MLRTLFVLLLTANVLLPTRAFITWIEPRLPLPVSSSRTLLNPGLLVVVVFGLSQAYITWIEPRRPLPGQRAAPGSPWPQPQKWINSSTILGLDPNQFELKTNVIDCDIIDHNIDVYQSYIFAGSHGGGNGSGVQNNNGSRRRLNGLELNVLSATCERYPKYESNENYNIEINPDSELATLTANTIWGGLRALETFSQLVWQTSDGEYVINATKIVDSPRFAHRGLLLDTARHFLPTSILKRNLDAMQWNKLNVFHWHLTDDQAFPLESKLYPNLTKLGAYSPKHVYSQDDVAEIIEYARLRGVRVLPEIDSPGHTRAIGNAMKHLLTPCYGDGKNPFTPNYTEHSEMEVLMPSNEAVYDFMRELIGEVKGVFKDAYVHLGMDEVYYACWKSNPDIRKFMEAQNMSEYHELEEYYANRLVRIVEDLGYKYITWQDPVDNNVTMAPNTLIQVWKDNSLDTRLLPWREYIVPIAKKGYQILLSACWYLNYISYGPDWKTYYNCDPHDFPGNDTEKQLVVGGEAALWGEYADGTNILSRLWPRASAVAERLWSPASVNDSDSAAFRLDQHRCRLLKRGIPAQPVLNGYCGDYEWGLPAALPAE